VKHRGNGCLEHSVSNDECELPFSLAFPEKEPAVHSELQHMIHLLAERWRVVQRLKLR